MANPAFPNLERIELTRAAQLRVHVCDERGRSLPRVPVGIEVLGKKPPNFAHPEGRITGPDGTAVFDSLPPGLKLQLRAQPKGYPPSFSAKMKLKRGAQNPVVKIIARSGATLRVRVLDAAGNEIPRVHLGVAYRLAKKKLSGWTPKPFTGAQPFVIRGVASKPIRLIVHADGFAGGTVDEDAVVPGQTRDVVVTLGAGNTLQGTLTDKDGRPRPDVRLRVWTYLPGEQNRTGTTVTDANGEFTMHGLGKGQAHFDTDSTPWLVLQALNGTCRFSAVSGQSLTIRLRGTAPQG